MHTDQSSPHWDVTCLITAKMTHSGSRLLMNWCSSLLNCRENDASYLRPHIMLCSSLPGSPSVVWTFNTITRTARTTGRLVHSKIRA